MKAQMMTVLCAFMILTAASPAVHSTLVMHLDFESGFSDSSGFGHHAVIDTRSAAGSVVTTTSGGISGNALSIQGLGWLAVPNTTSLSPTNAITMSAWVNPTGKI